MRQYGLKKRPQWVIMAYFEGNDLYDAAAYEQANPFIVTRVGSYILQQSIEAWHKRRLGSAQAAEARFLLVYVPTKLHVYLPYLNDPETLSRVLIDVPMLEMDEAGFLQFTNQTVPPELTRQNVNDQAELLGDLAAEQNIIFLDLTSTFQEEAGKGAELYYPFDTHWNQRGHDLAAQTIAKYIEDMLPVTTSKKTGN